MENRSGEPMEAASVASIQDLRKGMEVRGTVKRVADVGVFIDANLDGEGFLHASEYRPLGKDKGIEFQEGEPITVWVKAVAPDLKSFRATLKAPPKYRMSDLKPGMVVEGKVVRIAKFGAFVDIGAKTDGLVHVSEMADDYIRNPGDVVSVGDSVRVRILSVERDRISLSMKAAEEEEPVVAAADDSTVEEPLPTAMELALQRARQRAEAREKRQAKGAEPRHRSSELDDIIARTLKYHKEQTKKE